MDIAYEPATVLLQRMRDGSLSSLDLVEHLAERISRINPALNAIITLDLDGARIQARASDEARAAGEPVGPLHGLPMTIKDSIETQGMRTTCGAPWLSDHIPDTDADAVARLRAAGAIVIGKTNLPTMAGDYQSFNPIFGTTNNPWDHTLTPGGSSGGPAAAVATGLSPLELGSDLGGSIRIPASFCGVYGLKPTFGIIPKRGHIPGPPGSLFDADIGALGPIARSAQDIDLALRVIAGPGGEDARGWRLQLPEPRQQGLSEYRIAAWLDEPACPVDDSVAAVMQDAVTQLRRAGVEVDEKARPAISFEETALLRIQLTAALEGLGLSDHEFDAALKRDYGRDKPGETVEVKASRWMVQSHRDWMIADERRQHTRRRWAEFFDDYDLLITPTSAITAFPHDQTEFHARTVRVNGKLRPAWETVGWWATFVGVAYLPALSVPVGNTPQGLPVGMQIVGRLLDDLTVIDFAGKVAELTGGFTAPSEQAAAHPQ